MRDILYRRSPPSHQYGIGVVKTGLVRLFSSLCGAHRILCFREVAFILLHILTAELYRLNSIQDLHPLKPAVEVGAHLCQDKTYYRRAQTSYKFAQIAKQGGLSLPRRRCSLSGATVRTKNLERANIATNSRL